MDKPKPIRVLQSVAGLGSGGVETFLMNVYRYIDTELVQFDFLLSHNWETGLFEKEITDKGGRIFYLPKGYRQWLGLYRFLKKSDYQIIHCHRGAYGSLYLLVAKLAGIKNRILHSHRSDRESIIRRVETILLRPFSGIVSTKRFACGTAAGYWTFGKADFEVINNPVEIEKFRFNKEVRQRIRAVLDIDNNCILYGHIGRFSYVKNHSFLLDVFQEIHKHQINSKLLLVGDGELLPEIKSKVNSYNLQDCVIFLEKRNDVHKLLQAIDLVIFPSFNEAFSMAMLEMQTSSLRILASDSIPKEINITGNVFFKKLSDGSLSWAYEAIKMSKYDRNSFDVSVIKDKGFDAKETAERLQKYYLGLGLV